MVLLHPHQVVHWTQNNSSAVKGFCFSYFCIFTSACNDNVTGQKILGPGFYIILWHCARFNRVLLVKISNAASVTWHSVPICCS